MTPYESYSLIGALSAALAWFGARELLKKDKTADELSEFKEAVGKQMADIVERFTREIGEMANRNTVAVEGLTKSLGSLELAISEQRTMFTERFVTVKDHNYAMLDLRKAISEGNENLGVLFQSQLRAHEETFNKKLLEHQLECPMRRPI